MKYSDRVRYNEFKGFVYCVTGYFPLDPYLCVLWVTVLDIINTEGFVCCLTGYFPLDPYLCVLWVTSDVLMCTASIWHMCTMSMDRYLTLKYPMRYGRNKTKTMVGIKILFVWVISLGISSPVCILGLVDVSTVYDDGFCVPTVSHFLIYGSVFAFYVPLLIMIVTYVLTISILYQNQKLMQRIQRSDLRPCFRSQSPNRYQMRKSPQLLSPPSNEGSSKNVWNSHAATDESIFASSTNTDDKTLDDVAENSCVRQGHTNLTPPKHWVDQKAASFTCLKTFSLTENEFLVCDTRGQEWLTHRSANNSPRKPKMVKSFLDVMASPRTNGSMNLDVPRSPSFVSRLRSTDKKKSSSEVGESTRLMPPTSPRKTSCSTGFIDDRMHQIEQEMDLCLKSSLIVDKNGQTIAVAPDSPTKHYFTNKYGTKLFADSGDSDDDTSSNNSELISIKLHPETFYLYRLDLKKSSPAKKKKETETAFQNGNAVIPKDPDKDMDETYQISSEHHPTPKRKKSITRKMREKIKLNKASQDIKKTLIHLLPKKTATNEKKASKVLGIIFAVFVILWTPFFIMNILMAICPSCQTSVTPELMSTFLWMGYVASLANPIIYTMFNTAFRRAFVKILTCQCRYGKARGPDSVMMTLAATWQSDRRNTVTLLLKDDHRR